MDTETTKKWLPIVWSILKYALSAVLGGLGVSLVDGCSCVPVII